LPPKTVKEETSWSSRAFRAGQQHGQTKINQQHEDSKRR
jgi:hypothetical protein